MLGLNWIVIILAVVCIALGGLLGVARGSRRAFVRLILIAGCIVGAYFLTNALLNTVLNFQINGKSVEENILSMFGDAASTYADVVRPLVEILIKVVLYLALFLALQIVSLILQLILNIFVRPRKDSNGIVHKFGALGFIWGIIQGAACALVLAVGVGGIEKNIQKIQDAEIDEITIPTYLDMKYDEYETSFPGQYIVKIQDPMFGLVAQIKDADGNKCTLDGQVDALVASYKIGKSLSAVSKVDFSSGINTTNKQELLSTLDELNAVISDPDLTDEAKQTINKTINTVIDNMDLGVDVEIDITNINIDDEKDIVGDLADLAAGKEVDIKKMVSDMASSSLVLAVAESADVEVSLNATQKADAETALASVTDEATKAAIKQILGL